MKILALLIRFFKRLRSILVLCVTISLLFYYTFENEINILNSYAENELLPSINDYPADTVSNSDGMAVNVPVINGNGHLLTTSEQRQSQSNRETVVKVNLDEKNKYFPLLVRSPEVDPSLQHSNTAINKPNPLIFKEKYPVLLEVSPPIEALSKPIEKFPTSNAQDNNEDIYNDILDDIHTLFAKSWNQQSDQWYADPWPVDLIDTLDTLYIMNETTKFHYALEIIAKIDFKIPYTVHDMIDIPDLSSRALGGLLSAYDLSGEEILLTKAKQIGDFILRAFDTPNRLPVLSYPWKSQYNNRFPYQETNTGLMVKLSIEMTRLSQISLENKYFDAIYRILTYIWQTANDLPIKSLFPNIVDASGCKILNNKDLSNGAHQKDSMMKSINENLQFVYCHQLHHFTNFSSIIELDDNLITLYDTLAKLVSLTNTDIFETIKSSEVSSSLHANTNANRKDENKQDTPSEEEPTVDGTNSTSIFHEAMDNIINLMVFKPASPMDLTVISDMQANALYSPTTNELQVQLRRDFKFRTRSCLFSATLAYGSKIFPRPNKNDQKNSLEVASNIIKSCFEISEMFDGKSNEISFDWGSDLVDASSDFNDPPGFDGKKKIQDILIGKYTGFEHSFPIHNEVFASKVKESNLNVEDWKRTYSFIKNENFMNVKLGLQDVDVNEVSWVGSRSDLLFWINSIELSGNKGSLLSPEIIKSIFYLYRVTGDEKWRQLGSNTFRLTFDRIKSNNMGAKGTWRVADIDKENIPSYWISETLKYYYLLFKDSETFSFNDYIYTDNGHLLSRPKMIPAENGKKKDQKTQHKG